MYVQRINAEAAACSKRRGGFTNNHRRIVVAMATRASPMQPLPSAVVVALATRQNIGGGGSNASLSRLSLSPRISQSGKNCIINKNAQLIFNTGCMEAVNPKPEKLKLYTPQTDYYSAIRQHLILNSPLRCTQKFTKQ
jgi:hypothetical protein